MKKKYIITILVYFLTVNLLFSQNNNKVNLYFHRPYNLNSAIYNIKIFVNSEESTIISNNSSIAIETDKVGTLTIGAKLGLSKKTTTINAEIGESYFFKVGVNFTGLMIKKVPYSSVQKIFPDIEMNTQTVDENSQNTEYNIDNQPPDIIITSPNVTRGFKPVSANKQIAITGVVTDESGVYEVLINGEEINMQNNGAFSHTVLLAMGDNSFTVTATDTKRNTTTKQFTIERNSNKQETQVVNNQTNNNILQTGRYYALIIGNNSYQDPAITSLDEPINDATKLYNVLTTEYSFEQKNVIFLKNASYVQMIEAFDNLSNIITPNDNLLVFYAGHGWWDETKKLGYWLPTDAKKNSTAFWIANSRISDYMGSINSKHTLLIADACFSGSIFKTRSAFADAQPAINKLYELPSKKAMTSGNLKEVPDQSVFLEYLVKRLKNNTEKYISADMLFTSFRQAVMNNSPTEPQFGTIQNAGDEGGEFIFIRRK